MQFQLEPCLLELVQGNIVDQQVDAIVNAANPSLLGGGGVDGAIHVAAGPELLAECRTLGGCPTGEARITGGYRLPARYVIHTVGPVYRLSRDPQQAHNGPEAQLLAQAYRSSLSLAEHFQLKRIAFPSISTGAYGYPLAAAALIALQTVASYLKQSQAFSLIRFVFWDGTTRVAYEKAAQQLFGQALANTNR